MFGPSSRFALGIRSWLSPGSACCVLLPSLTVDPLMPAPLFPLLRGVEQMTWAPVAFAAPG